MIRWYQLPLLIFKYAQPFLIACILKFFNAPNCQDVRSTFTLPQRLKLSLFFIFELEFLFLPCFLVVDYKCRWTSLPHEIIMYDVWFTSSILLTYLRILSYMVVYGIWNIIILISWENIHLSKYLCCQFILISR